MLHSERYLYYQPLIILLGSELAHTLPRIKNALCYQTILVDGIICENCMP